MKHRFLFYLMQLFVSSLTTLTTIPAWALTDLEKEQIAAVPEWLPYSGCQGDKVYGQCFKWTADECIISVKETAEACVQHFRADYNRPLAGPVESWKTKVAKCAFDTLQSRMKNRRVDSQTCRNKGIWQ